MTGANRRAKELDRVAERDQRILTMLRAARSPGQIAQELGMSRTTVQDICSRLRLMHGLAGPKRGYNHRKLSVEHEYREMLAECDRHLGKAWVREFLGRQAGPLDEAQVVELQALHAALRYDLVSDAETLADVRERLREANREGR